MKFLTEVILRNECGNMVSKFDIKDVEDLNCIINTDTVFSKEALENIVKTCKILISKPELSGKDNCYAATIDIIKDSEKIEVIYRSGEKGTYKGGKYFSFEEILNSK